jgi:hypothetical protein
MKAQTLRAEDEDDNRYSGRNHHAGFRLDPARHAEVLRRAAGQGHRGEGL